MIQRIRRELVVGEKKYDRRFATKERKWGWWRENSEWARDVREEDIYLRPNIVWLWIGESNARAWVRLTPNSPHMRIARASSGISKGPERGELDADFPDLGWLKLRVVSLGGRMVDQLDHFMDEVESSWARASPDDTPGFA